MRRREFIITVGSTLLWPLAAFGQKPRSRVVGVLGFGSREGTQKGFAPVTYMAGGKQYIAFPVGGGPVAEELIALSL
jgi:hypothetical protein